MKNLILKRKYDAEIYCDILHVTISGKGDDNTGKKYNTDVRNTTLERYRAGEPVTYISSSTGIARSTIYTWINQSIAEARRIDISLYNYRLLEKRLHDWNKSLRS